MQLRQTQIHCHEGTEGFRLPRGVEESGEGAAAPVEPPPVCAARAPARTGTPRRVGSVGARGPRPAASGSGPGSCIPGAGSGEKHNGRVLGPRADRARAAAASALLHAVGSGAQRAGRTGPARGKGYKPGGSAPWHGREPDYHTWTLRTDGASDTGRRPAASAAPCGLCPGQRDAAMLSSLLTVQRPRSSAPSRHRGTRRQPLVGGDRATGIGSPGGTSICRNPVPAAEVAAACRCPQRHREPSSRAESDTARRGAEGTAGSRAVAGTLGLTHSPVAAAGIDLGDGGGAAGLQRGRAALRRQKRQRQQRQRTGPPCAASAHPAAAGADAEPLFAAGCLCPRLRLDEAPPLPPPIYTEPGPGASGAPAPDASSRGRGCGRPWPPRPPSCLRRGRGPGPLPAASVCRPPFRPGRLPARGGIGGACPGARSRPRGRSGPPSARFGFPGNSDQ